MAAQRCSLVGQFQYAAFLLDQLQVNCRITIAVVSCKHILCHSHNDVWHICPQQQTCEHIFCVSTFSFRCHCHVMSSTASLPPYASPLIVCGQGATITVPKSLAIVNHISRTLIHILRCQCHYRRRQRQSLHCLHSAAVLPCPLLQPPPSQSPLSMMTVKPRITHQITSSPINYRRCPTNTAVADDRTVTINTMITLLPMVADVTDY